MDTTRLAATVREIRAVLRRERLGFLAAALSYYAFISLVPLVLVAVAIASAVGGEAFADAVVASLQEVLSAEAADVLDQALTSGAGREGATLAGLAVLGWSGVRLFRALDHAFDKIYAGEQPTSLRAQFVDAVVTLAAIGLGVGGTVALSWILPLADLPLVGVLGTLATALVLTVVFLPMYYVLPDRSLGLPGVLPGAALAGGGWAILGITFSIYAGVAGSFQLYGVLGGVLLLLTWLYLGALLVMAGAVLNVAVADGAGNRQLQQGSRAGGDNERL